MKICAQRSCYLINYVQIILFKQLGANSASSCSLEPQQKTSGRRNKSAWRTPALQTFGLRPFQFDEREEETEPGQTGLRRPGESLSNRRREATVAAPLLDSTHLPLKGKRNGQGCDIPIFNGPLVVRAVPRLKLQGPPGRRRRPKGELPSEPAKNEASAKIGVLKRVSFATAFSEGRRSLLAIKMLIWVSVKQRAKCQWKVVFTHYW